MRRRTLSTSSDKLSLKRGRWALSRKVSYKCNFQALSPSVQYVVNFAVLYPGGADYVLNGYVWHVGSSGGEYALARYMIALFLSRIDAKGARLLIRSSQHQFAGWRWICSADVAAKRDNWNEGAPNHLLDCYTMFFVYTGSVSEHAHCPIISNHSVRHLITQ